MIQDLFRPVGAWKRGKESSTYSFVDGRWAEVPSDPEPDPWSQTPRDHAANSYLENRRENFPI